MTRHPCLESQTIRCESLGPKPSTLNPQPSTLNPQRCTVDQLSAVASLGDLFDASVMTKILIKALAKVEQALIESGDS
jgi:hypothetical protein